MITGRENYRRAIEFDGPEYLPGGVGCSLEWLYEKDEKKVERIRELQSLFRNDCQGWLNCWTGGTEPVVENGVRTWTDET